MPLNILGGVNKLPSLLIDLFSPEQYKLILDNMNEGVVLMDTHYRILYANPAFFKIHGIKEKNIIGRRCFEVIYMRSEPCDNIACPVKEVLSQRRLVEVEQVHARKGRLQYIKQTGIPIFEERKLKYIIKILRDVTEERMRELELVKARKDLMAIIQSSQDPILALDSQFNIVMCNKATERFLSWKKEEMIGVSAVDLIMPEDLREEFVRVLKRVKDKGDNLHFRTTIYTKSRKLMDVNICSSLAWKNQEDCRIVLLIRNITGEQRLRERIIRNNLRYDVHMGRVHLILEDRLETSRGVMKDLIDNGFKILLFSRRRRDEVENLLGEYFKHIRYVWLAKRRIDTAMEPSLENIKSKILYSYRDNPIVFIDTLEYLITENGFERVLSFIKELNEMLYITKRSIVFLSLDPKAVTERELHLINKEAEEVRLKTHPSLPYDLVKILEFINELNCSGILPNQKMIYTKFGISRTTAYKKLQMLIRFGILSSKKYGRSYIYEITTKGKAFLKTVSYAT